MVKLSSKLSVISIAFSFACLTLLGWSSVGMTLAPPVSAAHVKSQKHVIVYRPKAHSIVRHEFMLSGRANVFEANVSYKLVNKSGRTIHSGYTTASCGTGCWGYYKKNVVVPKSVPAGYYTLYVYEASAKDGSMTNVVKIWPLYMTKY